MQNATKTKKPAQMNMNTLVKEALVRIFTDKLVNDNKRKKLMSVPMQIEGEEYFIVFDYSRADAYYGIIGEIGIYVNELPDTGKLGKYCTLVSDISEINMSCIADINTIILERIETAEAIAYELKQRELAFQKRAK